MHVIQVKFFAVMVPIVKACLLFALFVVVQFGFGHCYLCGYQKAITDEPFDHFHLSTAANLSLCLALPAWPQWKFLKYVKDSNNLDTKTMSELLGQSTEPPYNENHQSFLLDKCPYKSMDLSACPMTKYRTMNGECNNVNNKHLGTPFQPLARWAHAAYDDGIASVRQLSTSGNLLPSARAISLAMMKQVDDLSPLYTIMHMTFGQLLDHDISLTAMTDKNLRSLKCKGAERNVDCGKDKCATTDECAPILVPPHDQQFHVPCLKFIRSLGVMKGDCKPGVREQLNTISSFLDAGMVYGVDDTAAMALRDSTDLTRGKLKVTPHPYNNDYKPLLPPRDDEPKCRDFNSTVKCFAAGDKRANAQVGLSALHTIFHRGHNTIEDILYGLHSNNPIWNGEMLFQETRKIMIGAWQNIVYKEFLPLLLGQDIMDLYGLTLKTGNETFDGYDATVDPSTSNSFATAAFRYGHSQITAFLAFANEMRDMVLKSNFSMHFFRPLALYDLPEMPTASGTDAVIRGMSLCSADKVNRHFDEQVTLHLNTDHPPHGKSNDLASLNIQRGRDHGLPGYNAWRKICLLQPADTFEDLVDISSDAQEMLKQLYEHPDDIDIYVGGISENRVHNGMVGPTFACLIAKQFQNLKMGDRYWFETPDQMIGFSPEQLAEIRKFSMAYFICENSDDIQSIQPNVLIKPKSVVDQESVMSMYPGLLEEIYADCNNEMMTCSDIVSTGPDFTKWGP